jgi:hypothetical protein
VDLKAFLDNTDASVLMEDKVEAEIKQKKAVFIWIGIPTSESCPLTHFSMQTRL